MEKIETFQFAHSVEILTLKINLGKNTVNFWHI